MKVSCRKINRRKYASEVLFRLTRKDKIEGKRISAKKNLRNMITKRIFCGAIIMKRIENDPDLLKIVVFAEPKQFFTALQSIHSHNVYTKWKNDEDVIVDVDQREHDLSAIADQALKPVNISSRHELMDGARNFLDRCNAVVRCVDTESKIKVLRKSILQVADRIYGNNAIEVGAYLYGSRYVGLALEHADVDIYVEIGKTFDGSLCNNIEKQCVMVELFEKAMKKETDEFDNVVALTNYRVPVLRFRHKISNTRGELAFRSGISVQNSKLVKLYVDLDERVKFVVCGVKYWFAENGLTNNDTFPSYAQTWLALYFLMQDWIALIPTVRVLRNMMPPDQQCFMIENWNCAIPDIESVRSNWKTECRLSGEELLTQFFTFYSNNVPMDGQILCTHDGVMRTRRHYFKGFEQLKKNPALNVKMQSEFSKFCLQDPFDRFKNLTRCPTPISVRRIAEFFEWCLETATLCKETVAEVSYDEEKAPSCEETKAFS